MKRPPVPAIGVLGIVRTLSEGEYMELLACEAVIETGWRTFVDVGMALARIRDQELYEGEYTTFEEYYRRKWQFEHTKVYYWIGAAKVFQSIALLPDVPKPDRESQLRPLIDLPSDQAQKAWQHAASKAQGRPVTARLVKAAVTELQLGAPEAAQRRQANRERVDRGRQVREGMTELLRLIMTKTAHNLLLDKAASLERDIRILFPVRRRRGAV